jgi:hypothetical protein
MGEIRNYKIEIMLKNGYCFQNVKFFQILMIFLQNVELNFTAAKFFDGPSHF